VFCGLAEAALDRATAALVKAEAQEGVSGQTPLLQRVRGWALMQLDRMEEASAAFDASLAVGRAHESPYEVAFTLRALAQLARLEGAPSDPAVDAESSRILAELGVVAVPDVPDRAAPADVQLLPHVPERPEPTVADFSEADAHLLGGSEPRV